MLQMGGQGWRLTLEPHLGLQATTWQLQDQRGSPSGSLGVRFPSPPARSWRCDVWGAAVPWEGKPAKKEQEMPLLADPHPLPY